ncbi:hypothetical protein [Methylomarinovum tepidoasis]|uniref:hypothetical protein n=1 Tax=Methylomarinovum tepidoasis TaxID=2840183 RepID=UPI002573238F|nr:hypothetical protein [Methylomarinovum sp. IN45]
MICVTVNDVGGLVQVPPAADGTCPNTAYVVLSATESALAYVPITAADILYAWTWGAGTVLFMWALGIAVGAAVGVIRRI